MTRAARAALYVRISQDRTGQEAGVQRQEADGRALAAARGWNVADVYCDNDTSAYSGKPRPEYERMKTDIAAGRIDAIIAYHPDRLYRRLRDMEDIIDLVEHHKVNVATTAAGDVDLSSAAGRQAARHIAVAARGESERMAERIRRQRLSQGESGRRQGGGRRHFGFNTDMTLRPDEAKAIEDTARKLLAGTSLYQCARDLNAAGRTTPGSKNKPGGPWRVGNLRRLMMRPSLAGIREHRSTIRRDATGKKVGGGELLGTYPGAWSAILTEDQHALLVARLASNGNGARLGARKYLLAGLLRCDSCGTLLVGSGGRYICDRGRSAGCGKARADARSLERLVLDRVGGLYGLAKDKPKDPETSKVETELLSEIRELEERLDALADNVELDERQLARRSKALKAKRDALQAELQAAAPAAPLPTREEMEAEWVRWGAYEKATAKALGEKVPADDVDETVELTDDDILRMREHIGAFVREVRVATTGASPKAFNRKAVKVIPRAA